MSTHHSATTVPGCGARWIGENQEVSRTGLDEKRPTIPGCNEDVIGLATLSARNHATSRCAVDVINSR
jgi:hypothetical protein